MSSLIPPRNSLVLYKQAAARVVETGKKRLTIELRDGNQLRVRPKDITLLHPGPIEHLSDLDSAIVDTSELLVAWELLQGTETNLQDLVELAFGEASPAAAWTAWQLVDDGLYMKGAPEQILVCTAEAVQNESNRRKNRELEQRRWDNFLQNLSAGKLVTGDESFLDDLEQLALGKQAQSRVLSALNKEQTEQNAHELLLSIGHWSTAVNPYPSRAGLPTVSAEGFVPAVPTEARHDLTHLLALAIDDEGNEDPDDALSWEAGRLWVHVADVAALVRPDDPLDRIARDRAANLYLPEDTVSMLPPDLTQILGLGLNDRSPALSFGIDLSGNGQVENLEIVPTWIKVTRWTYSEAEQKLDEQVPRELLHLAKRFAERRKQAGAIDLKLPEVRVNVNSGIVEMRPLLPLKSRDMVREAMLMAGEAVAAFAQLHDIPIPYTIQEPPSADLPAGDSLSAMFAQRRLLKPSRQSIAPGPHSGLGMEQYVQVTSPLRRYLDLIVHQQLRAFIGSRNLLSQHDIIERIGSTASLQRDLRRTERLSRQHWTIVYLMQNPGWQGDGVVIEHHGRRHVAILPDLDLDTDLYLTEEQPLDSRLSLRAQEVNLAHLTSNFAVQQVTLSA